MENLPFLEKNAIEAALNQNWKKAIFYNKQILKIDKNNLDAYLRLGFALIQSNQYEKAKICYKKALKIQPYHPTATENLKRIEIILTRNHHKNLKKEINLDPNLFLEIPGKTKTISLVNLGQKNILAQLSIGEKVNYKIRKKRVEIRNLQNQYLGHLPDDLSRRLQILLKAGSQFSFYIKEADFNKVVVFIREEKRGKKVLKYFPFQLTKNIEKDVIQTEMEEEKEEENQELTEADLEELADQLLNEEKIDDYFTFNSSLEEEE